MSNQLLMCEFHDATFDGLSVDQSFVVHINFSELVCYYATDNDNVAEVWTCSAELRIDGVRQLTVNCPVHAARSVSDLEFTPHREEAEDRYNLALLRGKRLISARLLMEGDASIQIEGGVAKITVGERRQLLEQVDWPQ